MIFSKKYGDVRLLSAGSADIAEEAPRLLLLYLADRRRATHASAISARTFMLCQVSLEVPSQVEIQLLSQLHFYIC